MDQRKHICETELRLAKMNLADAKRSRSDDRDRRIAGAQREVDRWTDRLAAT